MIYIGFAHIYILVIPLCKALRGQNEDHKSINVESWNKFDRKWERGQKMWGVNTQSNASRWQAEVANITVRVRDTSSCNGTRKYVITVLIIIKKGFRVPSLLNYWIVTPSINVVRTFFTFIQFNYNSFCTIKIVCFSKLRTIQITILLLCHKFRKFKIQSIIILIIHKINWHTYF